MTNIDPLIAALLAAHTAHVHNPERDDKATRAGVNAAADRLSAILDAVRRLEQQAGEWRAVVTADGGWLTPARSIRGSDDRAIALVAGLAAIRAALAAADGAR